MIDTYKKEKTEGKPTVFLVQENPYISVLSAADYGEIVVLFESGQQIMFSPQPAIRKLKRKLKDFNDDDYLFLEVNFISITNNLTFYFDKLLENYQIKIRRFMSGNYIKNYFNEDETDLSMMANKLNNGLNINEVQLVSKSIENKGFFEKFFQLFS